MANIEQLFKESLFRHRLIEDGDRVLVGLSGGKDSMTLLQLLTLRSRIYNPRFTVEAAYVKMSNIPYQNDEAYLQTFSDSLGVKLHIVETSFDPETDRRHTPCYLCSNYRRHALFRLAEREGFTKLALGHHLDDVVETALLNLTHQGSFSSMRPIMHMERYPFAIIRPLFFLRERIIREWAITHNYQPPQKTCPYDQKTQRHDMKQLLHQLEQLNPAVASSILHALGY